MIWVDRRFVQPPEHVALHSLDILEGLKILDSELGYLPQLLFFIHDYTHTNRAPSVRYDLIGRRPLSTPSIGLS